MISPDEFLRWLTFIVLCGIIGGWMLAVLVVWISFLISKGAQDDEPEG